ncbi:MAG: RNAse [Clostridia bacterium]|jgi:ribonuclease R|uniref:ribonuclease R n=1 Tax=Petroclostridium xylanilyticum TaxID=1792311 RepID=UPI000B9848E7|nr:ribonuclease R [Petroclostridium xylanilyticum]MBZ4646589.1 RNAse [Clostridia bacterium]
MTQKEKILAFMREDAYKPLLIEELITVLDVPREEIGHFLSIIDELEADGRIIKTKKNRYGIPERMGLVTGRFQGNERGFGFVVPDDETIADVFIPLENANGAMHNDRVIARFTRAIIEGKRAEGEIIRILKRANETIVGTFESSKYFGFVVPDDRKISQDVFVPKDEFNGAKTGQKVVVKITRWPEARRNPEGKVVEVLGHKDDPGTDIVSIIKQFNLSEEFPEDVIKQAERISDTVPENEIQKRHDLRHLKIVTIDGEDAKDLDDAVSVERLENGNYRLGVHIADVSHYVTENSPLDKEAFKRATSVYLVDRVIPMLPKKLSNGICSLNPQVDRLTLSVFMEIDKTGKVVDYEIFDSVIKTRERMTYTNVTRILEEEDPELIERYKDLIDDFKLMKELALILRQKRIDRGSIDFDFPEAKIILDEKGKPVEVKKYEITISNKIIEEFMLICNETVAEHMFWANTPFVYRIHEEPDPEKIENFNKLIYNLGYHLKGIAKIHPKSLQQLLNKIKGKKEERIISTVMLRSLMKAKYSHENLGHFGLAAKYYCHFTSPIRRYPDLVIHRIIKENLSRGITPAREEYLKTFVQQAAKQSSDQEIAAQEAERETEDLKKAEYMQDKVGEVFEGVISSVTSFGMFVELENTIEGLVRVSSMEDDYYIYDDKHYSLIGENKKKIYKIGDEVKVKLVKADLATRQIDFVLVEEIENDGQLEDDKFYTIPETGLANKKAKVSTRPKKREKTKEKEKTKKRRKK